MTTLQRAATVAFLYLLTAFAGAAPIRFGQYAPLTNTRYGAEPGAAELVSTGKETILVWSTATTVRAARLGDGEKRVAQYVMEAHSLDADAVWTGRTVLVAATFDGYTNALMGRQLDANGTPMGDVFQIQASAFRPKLASNGNVIFLLYGSGNGLHAATLSLDGREVLSDAVIGGAIDQWDVASNGSGFTVIASSNALVRVTSFDRNGTQVSTTTVAGSQSGSFQREVAIASDGDDYLAVWVDATSLSAAEVSAAGTASSAVALESTSTLTAAAGPSAVWTGDHYEVAYRANGVGNEVRLLHVSDGSPAAQRIDNIPSAVTTKTSLAYAAGRTRVAWTSAGLGVIRVRDTNGSGEGEQASFGASEQNVMAVATTPVQSMYVWYEVLDDLSRTHIGFRDRAGSWIERAIGTNQAHNAIAATNGSDFMVVISDATDWLAYRISAAGTVQGQAARIATRANVRSFDDIIWNGKTYALAGVDSQGRVIAATLSTSGILNPPIIVREPRAANISLEKPALGTDGTNTLIAWQEMESNPCFPICDWTVDGINSRLLGPDLQLLGDSPIMIVDNDAGEPHIVWSTEYTIVWAENPANTGTGSVRAQRIGRDGKRAGPAFTITGGTRATFNVDAVGMRIGYALTWAEEATGSEIDTHVARVRPDGTIADETTLPRRRFSSFAFTLDPRERPVFAIAAAQNAPPHHGASRIQIIIGDVSMPLPGAPILTVIPTSTTAELSWTPPTGAVNGYRLEYRVGDGAWNELDRFHGPEQTSASIRVSGNRNIGFRVRAFNDAGPGAYSMVAGIGGPKRRSVR